jgi:IS30 family transposase
MALTERKSGLAHFYKVERRTRGKTEMAIKQLLYPIANKVLTITSDNGKEFANRDTMLKVIECDYFCSCAFYLGKMYKRKHEWSYPIVLPQEQGL